MTDAEFRALLDLFMVSDPWPLDEKRDEGSHDVIKGLLQSTTECET